MAPITTYIETSFTENPTIQPFPVVSSTSSWINETTTLTPHDPTDLKELAWIIPAVIAGVLVMLCLGLLCFYGVRSTELFLMRWCYKKYGCCNPAGTEEYENLKDNLEPESYSLNGRYHIYCI